MYVGNGSVLRYVPFQRTRHEYMNYETSPKVHSKNRRHKRKSPHPLFLPYIHFFELVPGCRTIITSVLSLGPDRLGDKDGDVGVRVEDLTLWTSTPTLTGHEHKIPPLH